MVNQHRYTHQNILKNIPLIKKIFQPGKCTDVGCSNCLIHCVNGYNYKALIKWITSETTKPSIDWTKVDVDTPVLMSDDNKNWFKRYFAEYGNGLVWTWTSGKTSWSDDGNHDMMCWEYAKLADEETDK